jgi:truncated hemoglobin YjbI
VPASLYQRLGGASAINALVDGMYKKIFADPDLVDFFRKTNK